MNKKPVKQIVKLLDGLFPFAFISIIQQQLLPLCQQNLPELLQIQ